MHRSTRRPDGVRVRVSTYLPTIKQLQYLVALHEHGHFGRAADACFVSQSTLSAGIRELESLLGVTLVERSRRVVRFTPLGNAGGRQGAPPAARGRGTVRPRPGERQAALGRTADERDPDDRAVPAARACCRGCARSGPNLKLFLREETSARRARIAASRARRLRAARPALRHRRGREASTSRDDRLYRRLSQGRSARSARRDSARR